MRTLLIFCFMCLGSISGCARLDANLYNQQKLDAYRLDAYTGEVDFHLDASYDIPANLISEITLQSNDNGNVANIHAIYIGDQTQIGTQTVILYCHGNRDHMDFYWPRAKLLANAGAKNKYGVMMLDYRGFGRSEGEPTESGMYADVDAAVRWLQSNGLTGNRLILYGFSLGSAAATQLTAHPRSLTPAKIILEAPFASAETMVQDGSVLALPGSYFTNLSINNAEEIKSVTQSFMWIHGTADKFLRISTHGEIVFKNHPGTNKFPYRIEGAGHGTIPTTMGFVPYLNAIDNFIVNG